MSSPPCDTVSSLLDGLDTSSDEFGPRVVDHLLTWAVAAKITDLHLLPTSAGLELFARHNGVLHAIGSIPDGGPRVVSRLKVLAHLLTYRTDVPQEGRVSLVPDDAGEAEIPSPTAEARLATGPTVHGEKAVLRFFSEQVDLQMIDQLGWPGTVQASWQQLLTRPAGLLLLTGPAGSGKTTAAYASVRTLLAQAPSPRAVVTLEDPVEQLLDGVAQTAVGGTTGLTFHDGLRAALRHDPDVLLIGELRDRDTIDTAVRAALTGHLVIATMHTGSAAEAVIRLFDADVDPFLILSGLVGVLHQQLARVVDGSPTALAELMTFDTPAVRDAVRHKRSSDELHTTAVTAGMTPLNQHARQLVEKHVLTPTEYARLFGSVPE